MITAQSLNQSKRQEYIMSALNGDKSRFHRERKQNIARRKRTRELLQRAEAQDKSANNPRAAARKSVTA